MDIINAIQKKINNKKFFDSVIKDASGVEEIVHKLGYYLSYKIATRSKEEPKFLNEAKYGSQVYLLASEPEYQKLSPQEREKNIIKEGYVTHSFNGCNLSAVKKYGLGSDKIYDPKIAEAFDTLGEYFGVGKYYNNQGNTSNETYYAMPGVKTFHYGMKYSPERLYTGILSQEKGKELPIRVGEEKSDYMSRVLQNKTESLENITEEEKADIKSKGEFLISKFCTKKPVVAFIPINSKNYNLTAYHASTKSYDTSENKSLSDQLNEMYYSGTYADPAQLFTEKTDEAETNNMGNLVNTQPIPAKDLCFLEIPDKYEILQRMAISRGLKPGDLINYQDGKPYTNSETKENNLSTNETQQENKNDVSAPSKPTTKKELETKSLEENIANHPEGIIKASQKLAEQEPSVCGKLLGKIKGAVSNIFDFVNSRSKSNQGQLKAGQQQQEAENQELINQQNQRMMGE